MHGYDFVNSWGEGIIIVNAVYVPMTFAAVLGIILFTMFLTEKKKKYRKLKRTRKIFQLIVQ